MAISSRWRWLVLLAAVTALSCGPPRPSLAEWLEAWAEARAAVPDEVALEGREAATLCGDLLVVARELRVRLLPSPDPPLDPVVKSWLRQATHLAFECPSAKHQEDIFHREFRKLRILTAEVDAAVAFEVNEG